MLSGLVTEAEVFGDYTMTALRSWAIAILDFYHAAQNLSKAAAVALDGRTTKARQWFKLVRHQLRHGQSEQVIAQLAHAIEFRQLPTSVFNTLTNVHDYLQTDRQHINYKHYKALGLPKGKWHGGKCLQMAD